MAHRLDNLQAQRIIAGLSVEKLALAANVSAHWITRGEDKTTPSGTGATPLVGAPFPVAEAQPIADALGVSLAYTGALRLMLRMTCCSTPATWRHSRS